ncbi:MAG TPA: hypothetical protein VGH19_05305 [Verrucomicrobiae bacterium]
MKPVFILLLFATVLAQADFFSPFADSKPGVTVTDSGRFIKAASKNATTTDWFIRCRTCTGMQDIPAKIPPNLLGSIQTNIPVKITVTIHETEDLKTKTRSRVLEVKKIEAK